MSRLGGWLTRWVNRARLCRWCGLTLHTHGVLMVCTGCDFAGGWAWYRTGVCRHTDNACRPTLEKGQET